MAVQELRLADQTVDGAVVPTSNNPTYEDRSDVLFSYMNFIAYNNRIDMKIMNK